jgi:cyclohexanone monooxygenase
VAQEQNCPFYEAIIIGAGFAGIRMIHDLKRVGMAAHIFEAGSDVGGTWYWNRYPGARTDSESWGYCFQFSKELVEDWTWTERLPTQKEVQAYLAHVTDRFDLRRHISFNSRVSAAHFDEGRSEWIVTTEGGEQARCRYLISATGVLSRPKDLDVPGQDLFKGEQYHAPLWPKDHVSFAGKRVAIIGSAATAVQILPVIAKTASHAYLIQRTPNYVLPGRNYQIHDEEALSLKATSGDIFDLRRAHAFGLPLVHTGRTFDSVDDAQRQRIFEAGWEEGGFHYCFETFDDILTDQRSNDAAAEFVREKIRAIVKDPVTAEALCPDYTFFGKRPPSGHFYYEAFNRDNVTLVDIKNDPIREITANGIATGTREIDVDMIIYATGFDAGTGPLMALDLTGRDGARIQDKWADGPSTHMGLMIDGFPNMFMIMGPQAPFGNIPTIIEGEVDWIIKAIAFNEGHGQGTIEPAPEAPAKWNELLESIYHQTLLPAGVALKTWFLGANVPGKPVSVLFFFGGVGPFLDQIHDAADNGFPDFVVRPSLATAES